MRVGASRPAPEPRNLSSTEPHSPRLRNPNQLRPGERYPLHTAPKWGQSWTPIEGQSSTPIDSFILSGAPNRYHSRTKLGTNGESFRSARRIASQPLSQMSVRTVPTQGKNSDLRHKWLLSVRVAPFIAIRGARCDASAYLPQISFALVWIQDSLVRSGEPNHGCDGRVLGEECRERYQTRFREGFGAGCRPRGTQN